MIQYYIAIFGIRIISRLKACNTVYLFYLYVLTLLHVLFLNILVRLGNSIRFLNKPLQHLEKLQSCNIAI